MKKGALHFAKCISKKLYGRAVVVLLILSFLIPQPFMILAEEMAENQSENVESEEVTESEESGIEGGESMMGLLDEESDSPLEVPGLFSSKQHLPEVDLSTGALTEGVDFAVPPGRNDLTPEVGLRYNSQRREDGIAGYGWTISIPFIQRLNKTGSEKLYLDNYFTSSLGGELVKNSGTNEYTHRFEDGRYVRYTYINNVWVAFDKTGTRYTFGTTSAARQAATSSPSNVYAWMLEEIRDTNDNFIRFEYTSEGNQIYPSKITYSGNGSTDGIFDIDFTYETRPDQFTSYETGFRVDTTKRLSEVRASINDVWVQKYTLTYSSGVNGLRSLLASVQETGRDEDLNELSLPATTFGYSSSTPQYETHTNPRIWNHAHIAADVDGNGLADRSIFWSITDTSGATRLINKNEYPNFPTTTTAIDSEFWSYYNSSGSGANLYLPYERGTRFFDLNGDGRTDILHGFKAENGEVTRNYYQATSSLTWTSTSTPYASPIFACGITPTFRLPTGIFGDVNDDGFTDYVASSTQCSINRTYLGNGKKTWSVASSTFAALVQMSTSTTNSTDIRSSQLVDINGDGLDDWVYSDGSQTQFYLNTGTGWGTADARWTLATTTRYTNGWDRGMRFIDMNGDKLPDFVRAYTMPSYSTKTAGVSDIEIGTYNYVYINTGSGFATSSLTAPEYIFNGIATSSNWAGYIDYNELVDWNGDGIPDSASKTSTSTNTAISDVLVQTTYPTGGRTLITHKFTSQMASSSPELPYPVLVVTQQIHQDGISEDQTITYSYEGGKIYFDDNNIRDRRFAGFRKITKQDSLGYTDTYFHQGDGAETANGEQNDSLPLIGKVYREDIRDIGGGTLKKTFFKWTSQSFAGATQIVATSSTILWTLLVAGGGAGGGGNGGSVAHGGGGGGAGGYREDTVTDIPSGTYSITIGGGGTGANGVNGGNGTGSSIGAVITTSGGGGGGASNSVNGLNGGSGGGAGHSGSTGDSRSGGSGTVGQGNGGGNAAAHSSSGGGGGGSGASGGNAPSSSNGGVGISSKISGSLVSRAGGGGGAGGGAGQAGGGNGSASSGNSASANSGSGGGGGSTSGPGTSPGGNGGSGIAIIRFLKGTIQVLDQAGATETTSDNDTVLTWASGGTFQFAPVTATTTTTHFYTVLTSESVQDWEGGGTHKDRATEYIYATSTGNVLRKIERGEVSGNTDGTYSDTGSDSRTTVFTYSATTSANLTLPTSETILSHASTTVAQKRFYYDGQSLGTAVKGNLTKEESWITGSLYSSTTKQYDTFGLVGTTTDARGNRTTHLYDTYKLYPSTTTNPLGHIASYSYDYTTGAVKFAKDANNFVKETVFDPVGRVKEEWQSDLSSPSSLVLTKEYAYVDTFPTRVHERSYLNASTSVDTYVYRDGLGRTLQERMEAEESDIFIVKDKFYNSAGLFLKESLPYFAAGSARTTATSTSALYSTYSYDALRRLKSIVTSVGSTTYAYTPWQTRITDANGSLKDSIKDAYENLVQVVEHNSGSTYTTSYTYNEIGNLTRITDALNNVRNFTYDGLGRRLTAEDLHASADGTFGAWTYAYDIGNNLASSTDPKGQVIEYTYDALNRALTENYTGLGGTEVSYSYDSCSYGKGKLCVATSTDAVTTNTYNVAGNIASETKRINSVNYLTSYVYDRQNNVTGITYPGGAEVAYTYNSAGLPERVSYKPSGGSFGDIVADFDYAPTGAITYKEFGNNTATTYTYDANQLYRLKKIQTVQLGGMGGMMEDDTALFADDGETLGVATEAIESSRYEFDSSIDNLPDAAQSPDASSDQNGELQSDEENLNETLILLPATEDNSEEILTSSFEEVPLFDLAADMRANPYQDDGHKFKLAMSQASASSGAAEVEIIKSNPEVRLKKWNGEVNLGVSYKKVKGTGARVPLTDRIEWKEGNKEVHAYPLEAGEGMEDGGFEIEVYLKERPDNNQFDFTIDGADELDFFYQAPLNEEKRERHPGEVCTETQCVNDEGKVTSTRPENVIGSYAVYHKTKEGHVEGETNYATGKAFHIYRPKAIDANGNEIWGTLSFKKNVLSVVIPQEYLDSASYPVRVDPTFGYTTIGASEDYLEADWVGGVRYTTPTDISSITSLTWYNKRFFSSDHFKAVIYNSSGALVTNGVGSQTNAPASFGWATSTFTTPPTVSPSTNYGITVITDGEPDFKYDSVSGTYELWDDTNSYASPQSIPSSDAGNFKFSLYATYSSASSTNSAPSEPTQLQTEDQTNPANITDSTPEFDAIFNDANATNTANYYRIQVSTSSAFTSTHWDTGTTSLASSTPVGMRIADISYSGTTLASSTTYYWRIKFWDNVGAEGAWSTTTSTFSLAAAGGIGGNTPPSAPSGLLAEGLTDPIDITDSTPEFSAIYNDVNSTSTATHFRLQVATTSAFTSTYWDTGTTTLASSTPPGARIADVPYAGSGLASSTTYYWRIKFWDNVGAEGAWSTTTSMFSLAAAPGTTTPPLGFILQDLNYTYDAVGNITQLADYSDNGAGKVVIFGYDNLHRLTFASTTAASSTPYRYQYAYDALGNITGSKFNSAATTTYAYAGTNYANPHAATSIGGITHSYDNAGNLLTDGTWTHVWDYRHRLTSSGGAATSTYAYDHTTNRVSLTENSTTTVYANKYFDTDGINNTISIFDAQGTLLASIVGTGTTSYIYPDHLGSTNVSADSAGSLTQTLDYYPFGSERISMGDHASNRHYIGERHDESTNLSYLNARYYNSSKGNFISQDPTFLAVGDQALLQNLIGIDQQKVLSDPQQLNSYAYGRNNPVRFKDPKGLYIETGFDLAMLGLSVYEFAGDPSWTNAAAVGADLGALALPIPAVGGMALRAGKVSEDTYSVYHGIDPVTKAVKYVGITNRDPLLRFAEHRAAKGTGKEDLIYRTVDEGNLTKTQARLREQSDIDKFGLKKNGGQLINKINSISPTSPLYQFVPRSSGGSNNKNSKALNNVLNSLASALKQLSSALSKYGKK